MNLEIYSLNSLISPNSLKQLSPRNLFCEAIPLINPTIAPLCQVSKTIPGTPKRTPTTEEISPALMGIENDTHHTRGTHPYKHGYRKQYPAVEGATFNSTLLAFLPFRYVFAVFDGLQGEIVRAIIEQILPLGAEDIEVQLLLHGHILEYLVSHCIILSRT